LVIDLEQMESRMKTLVSAALLAAGAMLAIAGNASAVPVDAGAIARAATPDIISVYHQYGRRAGCAVGQKRNSKGYCRPSPAETR